MKDKRIGNDLNVVWSLKSNGQDFSLAGRDVSLFLKNMYGRKQIQDFEIIDNKVLWTFLGKDQKHTGIYSLELVINNGEEGMITTDACDFVRLVSCTCKIQNGEDACGVETEGIEIDSTVDFGVIDTELSLESTNPVENRVITAELKENLPAYIDKKLDSLATINGKSLLERGDIKTVSKYSELADILKIVPTNNAEALISAFRDNELDKKAGIPILCLIKKESSDEHFIPATLTVEDYRSVNAGWRLTFLLLAAGAEAKSSTGEIDQSKVYSGDVVVSPAISYLYNEKFGYVIPLGEGRVRPTLDVFSSLMDEWLKKNTPNENN